MKLNGKILGFISLFILALILAFAPVDKMEVRTFTDKELVHQLNNNSNYIEAEDVAHMIIDKDPALQVLDIRSSEDYAKYHIPGSINIPLADLFNDGSEDLIDPMKIKVLVSNGNTKAGQAWVLLRSKGLNDLFILYGGMNYWVDVFNNPVKPKDSAPNDELFTYEFRKSAGPEMMGNTLAENAQTEIDKPKPVIRRRPAKKKAAEGC